MDGNKNTRLIHKTITISNQSDLIPRLNTETQSSVTFCRKTDGGDMGFAASPQIGGEKELYDSVSLCLVSFNFAHLLTLPCKQTSHASSVVI